MIYNGTLNNYGKYTILVQYTINSYIIQLIVIFFMISISISSVFIYFHWYLKRRYIETTVY